MRRRWCARIMHTNSTWNVAVGTVKKSAATRSRGWFRRARFSRARARCVRMVARRAPSRLRTMSSMQVTLHPRVRHLQRLRGGRVSGSENRAFQKRRLADRDYVYVWVDGVHFNVRLDDDRLCTLVMIGARTDGTKELLAVADGYRESAGSWKTVLRDLKRRGMPAPMVALGDGAPGF